MNTYRVIRVESGHWAVEWRVSGVRQGLVWGYFDNEGDARLTACNLAVMEYREARRVSSQGGRGQRRWAA